MTMIFLFSVKNYNVPITVPQGRAKVRELFFKNKHVSDLRSIDMLIIKVTEFYYYVPLCQFVKLQYFYIYIKNLALQVLSVTPLFVIEVFIIVASLYCAKLVSWKMYLKLFSYPVCFYMTK